MAELPLATLNEAYFFVCDHCGRDSYGRLIAAELDEETEREAKEALGVEPWQEGALLMSPKRVTCQHCGTVYRAGFDGEAVEDDDA